MPISIVVNSSSNSANDSSCIQLEKAIMTAKSLPSEVESKNLICALCQAGGTNNAQGNLSVSWVDSSTTPSTTIKLTLKEVKEVIKTNKLNITLRQYARGRSQECHDVGELYDIPGDLYKKLQHMFGPISRTDSYWCSSFQMDCDGCPSNIRELLVRHYNSIFRKP